MASKIIYFDKAAVISEKNQNTNYAAGATYTYDSALGSELLVKTTGSVDDIKFRKITKAYLFVHIASWISDASTAATIYNRYLNKSFDETNVTWGTAPTKVGNYYNIIAYKSNVPGYERVDIGEYPTVYIPSFLDFGFSLSVFDANVTTPNGENKPYLLIECGEENVGLTVEQQFPIASSTISKALDTVFSWSADNYDETLADVVPESTKFRWRYAGESSYNEIDVGTDKSYTIPANKFQSGTLEWQVSIEANSGITTTTGWVSVPITEPLSSASVESPNNTVLDSSSSNVFRWNHIISNGTPQKRYDLQISNDNSAWTTIRTMETAETSVEIPAGTLSGGDLYWRVRTYNSDDVAGSWSDSAHCIVVAAPAVPSVAVTDNSPRFAIRWQQDGQQAYEIELDGKVILRRFGVDTSYRHTEYLTPGEHAVRVRIQNKYALWSDWGKTGITIENSDGDAINVFVTNTNPVELAIKTTGSYSAFLIYRDGVKIAETARDSYTDEFAVGNTVYQVRGVYADSGYYTMSNEASASVHVPCLMIAEVENPVWQKLKYSTSSIRSTALNAAPTVTYQHYVGTALPSAEIGESVEKIFTLDCAFRKSDLSEAQAFESLLGKLVCVKEPSGERYFGVLDSMGKETSLFYRAYSASITLVHWEEGVS